MGKRNEVRVLPLTEVGVDSLMIIQKHSEQLISQQITIK